MKNFIVKNTILIFLLVITFSCTAQVLERMPTITPDSSTALLTIEDRRWSKFTLDALDSLLFATFTLDTAAINYWNKSVNNLHYTSGNVGIGDTVPSYKLDVLGSTIPMRINGAGNIVGLRFQDTLGNSNIYYTGLTNDFIISGNTGLAITNNLFADVANNSLRVDGTIHLPNITASTTDSILSLENNQIKVRTDIVDTQLLADTAAAIRSDFPTEYIPDIITGPFVLFTSVDTNLTFTPTNQQVYSEIAAPLPPPFTSITIDPSGLATGESFYFHLYNPFTPDPQIPTIPFTMTSGGFYFAPGDTDYNPDSTATLAQRGMYRFVKMADGNLMIFY